mgnify:CR=1 FL=1
MNISIGENISVVTFHAVAQGGEAAQRVFEKVALAGINVDMISVSTPLSEKVSFGFTFPDDDLTKLLAVIGSVKKELGITPLVNSGNTKIVIKTDEMREQAGFASKVFSALDKVNAMILLVTTSEDEISVLVRNSDSGDALKALAEI